MKSTDQMKQLQAMKDAELSTRLLELRKEQFALRTRATIGQLAQTSQLAVLRREIARIKTILSERQRKVAA